MYLETLLPFLDTMNFSIFKFALKTHFCNLSIKNWFLHINFLKFPDTGYLRP